MVICFIVLSLFGSVVSVLGVRYDYETVFATMLHPNKKYFKTKNILLYLSGTIIVVSSVGIIHPTSKFVSGNSLKNVKLKKISHPERWIFS